MLEEGTRILNPLWHNGELSWPGSLFHGGAKIADARGIPLMTDSEVSGGFLFDHLRLHPRRGLSAFQQFRPGFLPVLGAVHETGIAFADDELDLDTGTF